MSRSNDEQRINRAAKRLAGVLAYSSCDLQMGQ